MNRSDEPAAAPLRSMAFEHWTCPACGKAYEVPPKWCPCQPYPIGEPHVFYFLLALEAGETPGEPEWLDRDAVRARAILLDRIEGSAAWLEETDSPPGGAVATLARQMIRTRAPHSGGSHTGRLLIREFYEPHVETLDDWEWIVVEVTPAEHEALLAAYRAEQASRR